MNALTLRGTMTALGLTKDPASTCAQAAEAKEACHGFGGQEVGTTVPVQMLPEPGVSRFAAHRRRVPPALTRGVMHHPAPPPEGLLRCTPTP